MQQAVVVTGAAAVLASIFLFGNRLHPFRMLVHDRRTIVSFSAGMSAAYVFVHVMPELEEMRRAYAHAASAIVRFEGMGMYFIALIGFLIFYGIEKMLRHLDSELGGDRHRLAFRLHIGGFSAYVGLMTYLLVANLEGTSTALLLFALAIAMHFVAVDHSLNEEHGEPYEKFGRYLLGGMVCAGWLVGRLTEVPPTALAPSVAFVSGAIVMNSMITELPAEKDGRFLPFMSGGVIYGLVLVPLG